MYQHILVFCVIREPSVQRQLQSFCAQRDNSLTGGFTESNVNTQNTTCLMNFTEVNKDNILITDVVDR